MARPRINPRIRFFSFVRESDNGCWLWLGSLRGGSNKHTYASFRSDGKTWAGHRWAFIHIRGRTLVEGLQLDHLCRTPACVNPWHLEQVTPRENTLRAPNALATINAQKVMCMRGHPFTPENTYLDTSKGRTLRICRLCSAIKSSAYRQRQRTKACLQ